MNFRSLILLTPLQILDCKLHGCNIFICFQLIYTLTNFQDKRMKIFFWGLVWFGVYCLMTPGLSKDIQCHVWPYFFLTYKCQIKHQATHKMGCQPVFFFWDTYSYSGFKGKHPPLKAKLTKIRTYKNWAGLIDSRTNDLSQFVSQTPYHLIIKRLLVNTSLY